MDASGFFSNHDSAKGLFRGRGSGLLSTSHAELSAREPFPLLDASASRFMEAALFFLSHLGGVSFLLLLVIFFGGGGVSIVVFERHVRSSFAAGATPNPLGLLLGLLLQCLVRRRDQHLRQKRDGWFLGQRSRTLNLLRLLRPALKKTNTEA